MHHKNFAKYHSTSIWFHWIIAFLVLSMLAAGFFLDDIPKPYHATAIMLHKSTGITILVLMMLRIAWIFWHGRAPLPKTVAVWEKVFARIVQYSMYVLVLVQPLSGWIMSTAADKIPRYFGLFPLPFPGIMPNEALSDSMFRLHGIVAWVLVFLIFFHIMGALKHHFIDKDTVLKAMLPGGK